MSIQVNMYNRLQSIKDWWLSKPQATQGYVAGGVLVAISILAGLPAPMHLAAVVGLYAGCFILATSFLVESYLWAAPKLDHKIGKLFGTAFGVMALAAATGLSRIAVNEATGQQASHFGSAVGFLVPLSFIPVLFFFVAIGSVISAIAIILWGGVSFLLTWRKPTDFEYFVLSSRVFAAFTLAILAGFLMPPISPTPGLMKWLAGYSALILDMERNELCSEHDQDRVIRVNDDLVIIGRLSKQGPQFVRRSCPLEPESTELGIPRGVAQPSAASDARM